MFFQKSFSMFSSWELGNLNGDVNVHIASWDHAPSWGIGRKKSTSKANRAGTPVVAPSPSPSPVPMFFALFPNKEPGRSQANVHRVIIHSFQPITARVISGLFYKNHPSTRTETN